MKPILVMYLCSTILYTQAQQSFTVAAFAATTGIGVSASRSINTKFFISGTVSHINANQGFDLALSDQNVKANASIRFIEINSSIQYYPFAKSDSAGLVKRSAFYISAGFAYRMQPTYKTSFRFRDPLNIGQFPLTQEETGNVDIDVQTSNILPFASLGIQFIPRRKKMRCGMEMGLYYHGRPQATIRSTGLLSLNDRNEEQLNKNISSLQFYPSLKFFIGTDLKHKKAKS